MTLRRTVPSLCAVVVLTLPAGQTLADEPTPVRYEIAPSFQAGALRHVEVTLRFQADADGVATLELPDASMGQTQLWRGVLDLRADGAEMAGEGPVRTLKARPGRTVTVRYRLASSLDHDPTEADGYPVTPWIRPSWLVVDGAGALATVADQPDAPVELSWKGWPEGFRQASNLEPARKVDPRRAVLVAGRDLRIVSSGPLRLAVLGRLAFTDAELAAELDGMLKAERAFFGDNPTAPYLVVATGVAGGSAQSFSGTGKADAFAMIATDGMTLDELRPLLAHELFHAWNPARLGKPIGPRGYWFSEGFTDFYARRLLRRARLMSPEAFAAAWNETLRAYGVSPARTLPGAQAADAFWTDRDAEKLPYQRGALLAALWDRRLRQAGTSLDAVLRDQAEAFRKRPDATLPNLFVAAMARAGVDVRPDLTRHIDQGAAIELPEDVFAPCGRLQVVTAPSFELGFEPSAASDGGLTVTGIKPDTAASRAGLRDGMTIVRKVSGVNGDATRPYELIVRDADGAPRTIVFLPEGHGVVRYQRLVLDPAAGAQACDFG